MSTPEQSVHERESAPHTFAEGEEAPPPGVRLMAWLRWLLVVVGVVIPIGVAASRMYRGMHYPTDTATSFLLGLALLFIAFHALPLGAEGVLDSPLPQPLGSTLYARVGDLPLALMMAVIGLVAIFRRARK